MNIKVSVNTSTNIVAKVQRPKSTATVIQSGAAGATSLANLLDVDATGAENGEVPIYDSTLQKYVVKPLVVSANNLPNISGGTF